MTLQVTRWRPDTCACELEYEWDDALPQGARIHSLRGFLRVGSEHAGVPHSTLYADVVAENTTKNQLEAILLESFPVLRRITDEGVRTWAPGLRYDWNYTGSGSARVLHYRVLGLLVPLTVASIESLVAGLGKSVVYDG